MCNNLDATIAIYLELQVSGFSVKVSENHLDRALSVEISVECKIFVISDLYYFQIYFSSWLKKSNQTFNTKFVIQCSVQMT